MGECNISRKLALNCMYMLENKPLITVWVFNFKDLNFVDNYNQSIKNSWVYIFEGLQKTL